MAKPDQQRLSAVIQPYLEPGEQLRNSAIAHRKPSFFLIIPLIILAVLPGLIAMALLTKYFIVALTDRRLLILRYKGKLQVQEVMEYRLGQIPPVKTSSGPIHTNLTLRDPRQTFFCQFHRAVAVGNREQAIAIVEAIQTGSFPLPIPVFGDRQQFGRPPDFVPPLPGEQSEKRRMDQPIPNPPDQPERPVILQTPGSVALRLGARRFFLQPDTKLREDDIAGLLSKENNGIVAAVDRNPNNPSILGLKNLSTSSWSLTLSDGEKRELESGRAVKLDHGTQIGFGFCDGVIER